MGVKGVLEVLETAFVGDRTEPGYLFSSCEMRSVSRRPWYLDRGITFLAGMIVFFFGKKSK